MSIHACTTNKKQQPDTLIKSAPVSLFPTSPFFLFVPAAAAAAGAAEEEPTLSKASFIVILYHKLSSRL